MVCVTTLPTLYKRDHDPLHIKFYTLLQNSPVFTSVVIIANFCRMIFNRIVHFQVTGTPCSRLIIAMAADDITNVNFGFKQFVTIVGNYEATNPL